ncbi:triose-phosphate isomerase [Terrimonas sp.]|uniref:triose-phosphate isomerase n=1 Tax=Terrimonas sp. TaxID=1914338 RepID=UPI000D50CB2C|nr:triose-phosphate isomerase [Terrimonas sp.]PVD51249.1 triose-phosphate isomerase [Terrimonas sp.]
MRQQVAAANWKMNLTITQAEELLNNLLQQSKQLSDHQKVVFAVPFPYLALAQSKVNSHPNYFVAAQNCSEKKSGAYTGETSVEMIHSLGVEYVVLGHSERREYFSESNALLAQKVDMALSYGLTPIFCCGEPLNIREAGTQNSFVEKQLKESLFHLSAEQLAKIVIAYEPIWAIGTGKTATADQAQEMHQHLRAVLAAQYGKETAGIVPILYGGSVKGSNAKEIFSKPDVDGGLVGGASLVAADFTQIIDALK